MKKTAGVNQSWREHRRKLLMDPKVLEAHQELQPEFAIVERIIRARVKEGITQAELARRMATKQSTISRLESGQANPSLAFLRRLAEALNSDLEIHFLSR